MSMYSIQVCLFVPEREPKIWEYLVRLLVNPKYNSWIRWEDEAQMIFKLYKKESIAQLWGERECEKPIKKTKKKKERGQPEEDDREEDIGTLPVQSQSSNRVARRRGSPLTYDSFSRALR